MKVYEKDKEMYMTVYGKYKLQYMKSILTSTVYEREKYMTKYTSIRNHIATE